MRSILQGILLKDQGKDGDAERMFIQVLNMVLYKIWLFQELLERFMKRIFSMIHRESPYGHTKAFL